MEIKKLVIRSFCVGFLALPAAVVFAASLDTDQVYDLKLDTKTYAVQDIKAGNTAVTVRAFENRVYVKNPVDKEYETMNIYVPEAYYAGKSINGYTAKTAPIFFPNTIGGYMPGAPGKPGEDFRHGGADAALTALSRGYVVAEAGARGRTLVSVDGRFSGKAPACIVDLKAAVRYLRYNKGRIPGNTEKIISDGTSAGGAMSALLGASGNNTDYEPYLNALGAAAKRDDIFAVMAYCPIANLEHADMAYEWVFNGVNDYHQHKFPQGLRTGGTALPLGKGPVLMNRPANAPDDSAVATPMSTVQIAASRELKALFPAYVNSLGLRDTHGRLLTLDSAGNGSFKDYIEGVYVASAQMALDRGGNLSNVDWLAVSEGKAVAMDFGKYAVAATRMKAAPAFDAFDLSSGENNEFGTETIGARHFTAYGQAHTMAAVPMADASTIKLMNPMEYIGAAHTDTARHWRIRHGSLDRDTSMAIPAMLALKAQNAGYDVDFSSPWGRGHDGDYDLKELFDWADGLCKQFPD